jgi:hypothetical protein
MLSKVSRTNRQLHGSTHEVVCLCCKPLLSGLVTTARWLRISHASRRRGSWNGSKRTAKPSASSKSATIRALMSCNSPSTHATSPRACAGHGWRGRHELGHDRLSHCCGQVLSCHADPVLLPELTNFLWAGSTS